VQAQRLLLTGLMLAGFARASVTLFLEEPFGTFGGMNPTGHAAIYLSHICAATPVSLRRCRQGEHGVVVSRYHNVGGYDWIAIPLIPYLYAVDKPEEVPLTVSPEQVATLRDHYRRANFKAIVPDGEDGLAPKGDWIQLVGSAYDRTIYAFGVESTQEQDDALIRKFNLRANRTHFNLLFFNCADFARKTLDFYYPHAIHRSMLNDAGIMTPKQAGRSLASYAKHHKDLQFSILVIPQVDGTVPRSTAVRGVLESLVKSKRYALPLVTVAVLHPYLGGSLAFAWIEGSRFDPRRMAPENSTSIPAAIEVELQNNHAVSAQ
jgi:hypothetical protein